MANTTVRNLLLGVIAAALVVIAVVLVLDRTGSDRHREHSDAWQVAHDAAESSARYYCTMNGAASEPGDLYSETYKNCVKDETDRDMDAWEADHPGKIWK